MKAQNTDNVKQVILVRDDLKMSKGKIAAQVAHASVNALLFQRKGYGRFDSNNIKYPHEVRFSASDDMCSWLNGNYTKITLKVNSEEELTKYYNQAKEKELPCSIITDKGFTELKGETKTCVAIGPASNTEIDEITKDLKLFS